MRISRNLAGQTHQAIRYTYDLDEDQWCREDGMVRVSQKPFAEGAMRQCYKANFVSNCTERHSNPPSEIKHILKIFKSDVIPETEDGREYFDEAITQAVAAKFALAFNKVCAIHNGRPAKLQFLPVSVVCLPEMGGKLCHLESFLEGHYIKHNDNDGKIESTHEMPQAFSHFTYEASNHDLLVCDIQGVGNFLTDPQIHSHNGRGFGAGNQGSKGIHRFLQTHRCNSTCRRLNLPPPDSHLLHSPPVEQSFEPARSRRTSHCTRAHSQRPLPPQRHIPQHQRGADTHDHDDDPLSSSADVNPTTTTCPRPLRSPHDHHIGPIYPAFAGGSPSSSSSPKAAAAAAAAAAWDSDTELPLAFAVFGRDCPDEQTSHLARDEQIVHLAREAQRLADVTAAARLDPACVRQLHLMSSLLRSLQNSDAAAAAAAAAADDVSPGTLLPPSAGGGRRGGRGGEGGGGRGLVSVGGDRRGGAPGTCAVM